MPTRLTSALLLSLALTTSACGSSMKNPDIKQNEHPRQRYELIVTIDAPGPFDSIKGYVSYEISNVDCTPKDTFEGVHEIPMDIDRDIVLARVDDKTYKGYFYRDLIERGNYYGLGVCQWDVQSAGFSLKAHDLTFGTGLVLEDILSGKINKEYFSKNEYFDQALKDQAPKDGMYIASGSGAETPPFTSNFGEPFPITMTAREVKP